MSAGLSEHLALADAPAVHSYIGGAPRDTFVTCHPGDGSPIPEVRAATLEAATLPAGGSTLRMTFREPVGVAAVIPFIARVADAARSIRTGDLFAPDAELGALISAGEAARVPGMIETAMAQGARILAGADPPSGVQPGSAFVAPAVPDIPAGLPRVPDIVHDIVHDEVFGPVLTVQRFSGAGQAVAPANDSPIGGVGPSGAGRVGHEACTELKTVDPAATGVPPWYRPRPEE